MLLILGSANGFSSNADEIRNATLLFDNIVIKPYQHLIIDALDEILAYNNITLNLYFKTLEPLEFMELDDVVSEEQREEETGVKQEDDYDFELQLAQSKDLPDDVFEEILHGLEGEVIDTNEWEMVDIRDVDEENESEEDWANEMIELAEAVKSDTPLKNNPNGFSILDKSYYKIRYKYAKGSRKGGTSRKFCSAMMNRSKRGVVYRIEDIDKASRELNFKAAELPMHKGKKYDLFKYKGGVYCRHKWQQVLYRMKVDAALDGKKGSKKLADYDIVKEIPKSYRRRPAGTKQAEKAPVNMPNNGHHPHYNK